MEFNKRILDLIERKRILTQEINADLQYLNNLGKSQTGHSELFNIPLLPTNENSQAK